VTKIAWQTITANARKAGLLKKQGCSSNWKTVKELICIKMIDEDTSLNS